jgi:hypothetical protein
MRMIHIRPKMLKLIRTQGRQFHYLRKFRSHNDVILASGDIIELNQNPLKTPVVHTKWVQTSLFVSMYKCCNSLLTNL